MPISMNKKTQIATHLRERERGVAEDAEAVGGTPERREASGLCADLAGDEREGSGLGVMAAESKG